MSEKKCDPGKTFVERPKSPMKPGQKKATIWNSPVQFCAKDSPKIEKKGYTRLEGKAAPTQAAVAPSAAAPSREMAMADLKAVGSAQELMAFYQKYGVAWPMTKKGEAMTQENFKKSWKDLKKNLQKQLK